MEGGRAEAALWWMLPGDSVVAAGFPGKASEEVVGTHPIKPLESSGSRKNMDSAPKQRQRGFGGTCGGGVNTHPPTRGGGTGRTTHLAAAQHHGLHELRLAVHCLLADGALNLLGRVPARDIFKPGGWGPFPIGLGGGSG